MSIKLIVYPNRRLNPEGIYAMAGELSRETAQDLKTTMAQYPSDQAWKSRAPKSGRRAGGQRTGAYGRGWLDAPIQVSKTSATVVNPVPYAIVVGGSRRQSPGQARVLAARGWPSIQDVGPAVMARHKPNMRYLSTGKGFDYD